MAKAAKAKKKVDPFKTRKTRTVATKESDTVEAPAEVAAAIDSYRDCQDQAKHFEGEATIHKNTVMEWAQKQWVARSLEGQEKSFKVQGDETMVTFVAQDSSAGLTDEDVAGIAERWGDPAADELIMRDFRSIRFDPKVLEAHYDAVVEALQALPEEIVSNLFRPMLMMARPGIVERAKRYAKSPEELQELLQALKVKTYIR